MVLRLGSLLAIAAAGCEIVFPLRPPPPDAPPDAPPLTRRVFVTESQFTGAEIGGLAGADTKCQDRARAAGLSGTYFAWLSDSTGSPASRFVQSTVPYVRIDGMTIANDWAELISGQHLAAIDQTDTGTAGFSDKLCANVTTFVFTNTRVEGTLLSSNQSCDNWSLDIGPSGWGNYMKSDASWTLDCNGGGAAPVFCGAHAALYCFEQ